MSVTRLRRTADWVSRRDIFVRGRYEYDLFRIILFDIMSHLSDTYAGFFREGCPPRYCEREGFRAPLYPEGHKSLGFTHRYFWQSVWETDLAFGHPEKTGSLDETEWMILFQTKYHDLRNV